MEKLTYKNKDNVYNCLYKDKMIRRAAEQIVQLYGPEQLDADELMQESIILLDNILLRDTFRGESKITTFFIGIMKNVAFNARKKEQKTTYYDNSQLSAFDGIEDSPEEDIVREEEHVMSQVAMEKFNDAIKMLSDKNQKLLLKYYFDKRGMGIIAKELGYPSAEQVKKAVHRARQRLKEIINSDPRFKDIIDSFRSEL